METPSWCRCIVFFGSKFQPLEISKICECLQSNHIHCSIAVLKKHFFLTFSLHISMFNFDPLWGPWVLVLGSRLWQFRIWNIFTNIVVNFGISGAVVLEIKKNTHPLVSLRVLIIQNHLSIRMLCIKFVKFGPVVLEKVSKVWKYTDRRTDGRHVIRKA